MDWASLTVGQAVRIGNAIDIVFAVTVIVKLMIGGFSNLRYKFWGVVFLSGVLALSWFLTANWLGPEASPLAYLTGILALRAIALKVLWTIISLQGPGRR